MKNLLRITDFLAAEILQIFAIADEIKKGKYKEILNGKTVVLFFPNSSIRTRVTFEKAAHLFGGQTILFPSETLDKKEDLKDVCGYLNNWADLIIVRHKNFEIIQQIAKYSNAPVINAMTNINHPCEIISDMYSLSKIRKDFLNDKYLFCGTKGNIGLAWKEASETMGLKLFQCCPKGYEMDGIPFSDNLSEAVVGKDIICTDSLPQDLLKDKKFQVTKKLMDTANKGALLNPCPPFFRGEEVSADVIDSEYFVGYEFKKNLLFVQQAIIVYLLNNKGKDLFNFNNTGDIK